MAKGNLSHKKEKKKPKKMKGNPMTSNIPGRTYPGSFPIMPDLPGTNRPGLH